ncbi:MAG: undecaprenyl-diphosphate phosphatase [Deltaproteobacteria bacterium]|nr:undecaprenyl-diphosphate phosphatase [Deltaproteobacteria bacterium]
MSALAAILLGLVQAATEFLPVSSTAHLLVVGELLGQSLDDERFRAFSTIIQLGTTAAVVVYFRGELGELVREGLLALRRGRPFGTPQARLGWLLVAGTVPAALAGKLLERRIEALGNAVIAGSLVVWGLVLWSAERLARHERRLADVGVRDALLIGVGQALALVPGTSRSGATITTAMFLGLRREDAARYSFLLSVPITLGAGLYKLRKVAPVIAGEPSWQLATALGTAVSFLFGLAVIAWLLRWLRTRTTYLFVGWRLAAGLVVALLLWQGVLPSGTASQPPATSARP